MYELLRDRVWARVLAVVVGCWAMAETGLRAWRAEGSPPLAGLDDHGAADLIGRLAGGIVLEQHGATGLLLAPVALLVAVLVLYALRDAGRLSAGRPAPRPR